MTRARQSLFRPEYVELAAPVCKHSRKGKHTLVENDGPHFVAMIYCERCKIAWVTNTWVKR